MTSHPQTLSMNSESGVYGQLAPRLCTPPLRELSPETSYGYGVIDFARDVLNLPLDPWQEQIAIRVGEMLPDGRPRFRHVLIVVARQNGKTHLAVVLTLYWMFVDQVKLVLGMSTGLEYAKEPWAAACDIVESNPWLAPLAKKPRTVNGGETLETKAGGRYKIAASNRRGGRGLSVDRLIIDELREHATFDAWNAAEPAMSARPHAQLIAITNQGDTSAVVLDSLRVPALEYIKTGQGDPRLGLFEYSAPPEMAPDSLEALAMANPNLGHRIDPDTLVGKAKRAVAAGGEELAGFKTEVLCQRVALLDPAIDPDSWDSCATDQHPNLAAGGYTHALCLDVSLDGSHATLVAASHVGERIFASVVAQWAGPGCTSDVRRELRGWIERTEAKAFAYFPGGPAASIAADFKASGAKAWPPRGVKSQEIRAENVTQACMGLAEQVRTGVIQHSGDPLLTAHINASARKPREDGWVFDRRNSGPIDAAYALAGAVHVARVMPRPVPVVSY
jgi:hypothetical protein